MIRLSRSARHMQQVWALLKKLDRLLTEVTVASEFRETSAHQFTRIHGFHHIVQASQALNDSFHHALVAAHIEGRDALELWEGLLRQFRAESLDQNPDGKPAGPTDEVPL